VEDEKLGQPDSVLEDHAPPGDQAILIPSRLIPYVQDLAATGLFGGPTFEAVIVNLLEEAVREKVGQSVIKMRRHGKRQRD